MFWRRVITTLTGTQAVTVSPNAQSRAFIMSFSGVRTTGNPHSAVVSGGTGSATNTGPAGPIAAAAVTGSTNLFLCAVVGANGSRTWTAEALSGVTSVVGSEAADSAGTPSLMGWSATAQGAAGTTTVTSFSATMSSTDSKSIVFFDLVEAAAVIPADTAERAADMLAFF